MTKKWEKKIIDLQLLWPQEETLCTHRIVAQEWRWVVLGKATSVWEKTSGLLQHSVRSKIYLEDFPCGLEKHSFCTELFYSNSILLYQKFYGYWKVAITDILFGSFAISLTSTIFKTLPKSIWEPDHTSYLRSIQRNLPTFSVSKGLDSNFRYSQLHLGHNEMLQKAVIPPSQMFKQQPGWYSS